jgi:hypothetical protein
VPGQVDRDFDQSCPAGSREWFFRVASESLYRDPIAMVSTTAILPVVLVGYFSFLSACASPLPPRIMYKDAVTVVQVQHDPRSGPGHSHPSSLSPQLIKQVLTGLRVQKRGDFVLSLLTGDQETVPAFSAGEIDELAPKISQALAAATPTEVVGFYRRVSDASLGLGVTSGGMLVQDGLLYVVLANHHSRFADVMREGLSYELDPVRDPLQSLRSRAFKVSFIADRAVAHPIKPWDYIDPGKVVVLDLQTLETHFQPATPALRP